MKKKNYTAPFSDAIKMSIHQYLMYSKPEEPVVDPSDPNAGMAKGNNLWSDDADSQDGGDLWGGDE